MTHDGLKVRERPSPNHNDRRGRAVDMLLLHYTGMRSAAEALERLCDPAAEVSAHWLVEEDGTVWRLVDEDRRAWHAGRAWWAGESDINACSIGVEIHNPGHEFGYREFPEAQVEAVIHLCRGILGRHAIPAARVLGHSDVAPLRKADPGELFPWARLAAAGIGRWPDFPPVPGAGAASPAIRAVQTDLARIGYGLAVDGVAGPETRAVIAAFQRHFRPGSVSGDADAETVSRIRVMAGLSG
ncbi:MAG: N-acetylmuramoyl-L-alanine amidase [Pseudomonadota bacterium]|nr:N-acetylmuramoyl-L-alanine amidase [Pseudomonadota bacterium]